MTVEQPRPTSDDRIRAALWFAERGFRVFSVWGTQPDSACRCPKGRQCENAGKHPIPQHGFQDGTTDPERIRVMLSAASDPNWGMLPPEGVFILDVDGAGIAQLAELEERLGRLPNTLRTATAHGFHVFLRWPQELPRPIGHLFGFVTRWGSGRDTGYVIGPRSIHATGAVYAPAGGTFEIAQLPEGWARAVVEPKATLDTITIQGGYQIPSVVGAGESRYEAIRAYTAHLYNRGLTKDEMWPLVLMELAPHFAAGLSEGEIRSRFDRVTVDLEERLGPPRLLSAKTNVPTGRKQFPFITAREAAQLEGAEIDWAWSDYLAFGAITEIVGPPKAGKTTLVFGLVQAYAAGSPFLDRATQGGPVVVLTEQGPTSLRAVLERTGLSERDDVHFLLHRDTRGGSWPDIVTAAVERCQEIGSRFLVVDTLPAFAGLAGETENNAGDALAAMVPLLDAAGTGLAVLMNRHRSKGLARDVAEEGRGSGAISGTVDVIVVMRRKEAAQRKTIRVLAAASRFDETPDELIVELEGDCYIALGDEGALEAAEARAAVLRDLAATSEQSIVQLVASTGKTRQTLQGVLDRLVLDHQIERTGEGRARHPFRYSLVKFLSARTTPPVGGEEVVWQPAPDSENPGWSTPCRAYDEHRSSHYRTTRGWSCHECEEAQ